MASSTAVISGASSPALRASGVIVTSPVWAILIVYLPAGILSLASAALISTALT